MSSHERDFIGYGGETPKNCWPLGAKIAVNFVVNYEEGAERNPLDGDRVHESYGVEFPLVKNREGLRHLGVESLYEYGARSGIWRLIALFESYRLPLTFFACAKALERNPPLVRYLKSSFHEIAGHGYRWIDYSDHSREEENREIIRCLEILKGLTGKEVRGWYTGRRGLHTRDHLVDIPEIVYDSDSYADDLPYYYGKSNHLIIPYNLDCNDFRFTTQPGFSSPEDFFLQLKMSFDALYLEGERAPKMLSIGLHPRISGRPARSFALKRFIDYISTYEGVWITRRIDIANHWLSRI